MICWIFSPLTVLKEVSIWKDCRKSIGQNWCRFQNLTGWKIWKRRNISLRCRYYFYWLNRFHTLSLLFLKYLLKEWKSQNYIFNFRLEVIYLLKLQMNSKSKLREFRLGKNENKMDGQGYFSHKWHFKISSDIYHMYQ